MHSSSQSAKLRQLQVTSLAYFDWAEIETDPEAQEQLLRSLIGLPADSKGANESAVANGISLPAKDGGETIVPAIVKEGLAA